MIILPATDILNGQCVRLYKGDYAASEKVAEDALSAAKRFYEAGAEWLHAVDLNGAKEGGAVNFPVICEIINKSGLSVEIGGGIRNIETAAKYINAGAKRIILGSAALNNPKLVKDCVKEFTGEKTAVGIDAKNGFVATEGWLKNSSVNYIDLAMQIEDTGVKYIIVTDISRDGTLKGVNLEMLARIQAKVKMNIIASGGVRDMNDIKSLKKMNLYGAICGKSIYSGTIDLKEALAECRGE